MLNTMRHASVFDPMHFPDLSIVVIGCGAVGSSIALGLAKLGLTNITLVDHDRVEAHNIANQYLYGPDDIGEFKVEAAKSAIHRLTGTRVRTLSDSYKGARLHFDVVFMCVDSMAVRKLITDKGLFINPKVQWAFDTRIDSVQTMSYAIAPSDLRHMQEYAETLYDDSVVVADRGACGNVLSIGPTANIASQNTLWLFMDALNNKLTANEVIMQVRPQWKLLSRRFASSRDSY